MHPEAHRGVFDMIKQSGIDLMRHEDGMSGPLALDIGGADVNGSARELFAPTTAWFGLDIAPSPGVDIVADATTWRGELDNVAGLGMTLSSVVDLGMTLPAFDIVLCTEVLEHVEHWPLILGTIHAALVPGGYAFITCASTGRRPHGARGEHDVPDGEWYRNVDPEMFQAAVQIVGLLEDYAERPWSAGHLTYNPNPGDLYAWLRK